MSVRRLTVYLFSGTCAPSSVGMHLTSVDRITLLPTSRWIHNIECRSNTPPVPRTIIFFTLVRWLLPCKHVMWPPFANSVWGVSLVLATLSLSKVIFIDASIPRVWGIGFILDVGQVIWDPDRSFAQIALWDPTFSRLTINIILCTCYYV